MTPHETEQTAEKLESDRETLPPATSERWSSEASRSSPRPDHRQAGSATDAFAPGDRRDPSTRWAGPTDDPMAAIVPPAGSPPSVAESFGEYELLREIARGGMGVVYEARHKGLDRVVALKMILSGQFATAEDHRRFRIEAEAIARLDHPHIVPIYEIGEWGGQPFFSMKYIPGGSLLGKVDELRTAPRAAVAVLAKIAQAVHYAHQRGILHRDLKPANVLIGRDGEPYVTDFGLAKKIGDGSALTQTGQILGTPAYMAPEQAAGGARTLTTAADVYSLGAILYQLLTGRPPFQGESVAATLIKVMEDEPEPIHATNSAIDRNLEAVVLKSLAKDPEGRYESAGALANDLGRWLDGEPIRARPASSWELARSWLRKNFAAAWMAPVVGLVVGLLCGAYSWSKILVYYVDVFGSAYDLLPSVDRPWLTTLHLRLLGWPTVLIAGDFVFFLALSTMGLFTVLLARSKNRMADIAAGLVTGSVTGVVMFTSGFGALYVQTEMRARESAEFGNWNTPYAAWLDAGSPHQSRLLERYPDLQALAPEARADTMARKWYYDRTMALAGGMAKGFLLMLVFGPVLSTAQTLIAGAILRRSRSLRETALRYLEMAIPGISVVIALPLLLLRLVAGVDLRTGMPLWYELLIGLTTGMAVAAAWFRWQWWVRLAAQGAWVTLFAAHSFILSWVQT